MINKRFLSVIGLVMALCVIAFFWKFKQPTTTPQVAVTASNQPPPIVTGDESTTKVKQNPPSELTKPSLSVKDEITARMIIEYETSKNYREFFEWAKQHPTKGGMFYAQEALRKCFYVNWDTKRAQEEQSTIKPGEDPVVMQRRLNALNSLVERCGSFIEVDTPGIIPYGYSKRSIAAGDPLFKALGEDFSIYENNPEQREKGLREVFRTQNPLLLVHTNYGLLSSIESGTYFDGKWYKSERESKWMDAAQMLVFCQFGAPCDSQDTLIQAKCANGECYNDRASYVRDGLLKGNQADYDEAMKLTNQITNAIRNQDTKPFMAPPGMMAPNIAE